MNGINKDVVIWSLEELASRNDQERLWLSDGSTGEVSSFTEAVCGVFDDGGVSRALDSNRLPDELACRFRDLSVSISRVPQDALPAEQIHHPAMKDVARIAGDLLRLLSQTN